MIQILNDTARVWPELIDSFGSKRGVIEAYWRKQLTQLEERMLEQLLPPEILIGYKPIH